MFKKHLALLMVIVMVISMMFSSAFAAPDTGDLTFTAADRGYEDYEAYEEVIRDREGDMTPEDMVGIREIEDNPYGAVKSSKEIENQDHAEGLEGQVVMTSGTPVMEISQSADYGVIAREHIRHLSEEIGARLAETEEEHEARDYIRDVLEDLGYEVELQPFSVKLEKDKKFRPKAAGEEALQEAAAANINEVISKEKDKSKTKPPAAGDNSSSPVWLRSCNVIAQKPGLSDKVVIVGAHYDSVTVGGSTGADDNASGVSIMLETAEIISQMTTPYTIRFVAFGAEEEGLMGSQEYVANMSEEDIANTVAMINLDTCIGGDYAYVYGGAGEAGWVRDRALELAQNLGLELKTNPGLNPEYPEGTAGDWSDHAPFRIAGIPYAYFESTNWEIGEKDGYDQTVEYGPIMHTQRDTLSFLDENFPGRVDERLNTFVNVLTNLLFYMDKPVYKGMNLSGSLASMTEERVFEVAVDLGYMPDLDEIQWTFGEIPFEDWKKVNYANGSTIEESFVKFETEPYLDGTTVKASIKFELPFGRIVNGEWVAIDTLDRRPYPRTYYPRLLGTYDLAAADAGKDVTVSAPIKLNAYDSYHTWDELEAAIDRVIEKTKPDRYIEHTTLGESIEGRDCHFVILAEDEASVDGYLNETLPLALSDPAELQRRIESGEMGDYKIPIWFNNIHPDEAPGPDAVLGLLEGLAARDKVQYDNIDIDAGKNEDPSTKATITLNVPELLDNFIFLFNFTVNPDGRFYNTRTNVNGFDINRDCSFQTQPEAVNTVQGIVEWKPLTFLDFHGHVKEFLVEPTTAPHDPNYEYDLLIDSMMEQAYLMGRAGIASTRYESFIVPREDYESGWDDASPVYTPMYAMHHGALGHTIEIPDINEHSYDALVACGFAAAKYALDNKDALYTNQLEIFRRGLENIDASELVDPEFVDGYGNVVGRPRGENESYFPEYYVIPVDGAIQKNILEAHVIADYMLRNGVLVDKTVEDVTIGDITYPAGSYVIDMHQAIRGYANAILSDGFDISTFNDMYAETVMNFQDVWGFDRYIIREEGVFEGKTERIDSAAVPETVTPGAAEQYIIKNNNNDAIKAVNELLSIGGKVGMAQSSGEGYEAGDFVISSEAFFMIKDSYYLEALPFDGSSSIKEIPKPVIGLAGSGNVEFVLRELGFDYTSSLSESNVILSTGSTNVKSYIDAGVPYVGIGPSPISFVKNAGILNVDRRYTGYEGLLKSIIAKDSLINANYEEEELILNPYGCGAYFTSVPDNVKVLARVTDEDDYFKAGWWPGNDEVIGAPLAVQGEYNDTSITLFAFNMVNKGQPKHYFRMLANTIFLSVPSKPSGSFDISFENIPEKFELGGSADATAVITNNTAYEQQALLVVAIYDNDTDMMISYAAGSEAVAAGGTKKLSAFLRIPDMGNYIVKAFVWDNWVNQNLLSEVLAIPVE